MAPGVEWRAVAFLRLVCQVAVGGIDQALSLRVAVRLSVAASPKDLGSPRRYCAPAILRTEQKSRDLFPCEEWRSSIDGSAPGG